MFGRSSNLRERLRSRASGGPAGELIRELDCDEAYLVRCLAYLLRHSPREQVLILDSRGWAPLDEVVVALRRLHWSLNGVNRENLAAFICGRSSDRFEVAEGQVRARYGHSVAGITVADPKTPPDCLFHGTTRRAVALILEAGLRPMGRTQVHLTTSMDYAWRIASVPTEVPQVLRVMTHLALRSGSVFRQASDHVWLVDAVHPSAIEHPVTDC